MQRVAVDTVVEEIPALEIELVRLEVRGRPGNEALTRARFHAVGAELRTQRAHDRLRNLLLHGEDVGQLARV